MYNICKGDGMYRLDILNDKPKANKEKDNSKYPILNDQRPPKLTLKTQQFQYKKKRF